MPGPNDFSYFSSTTHASTKFAFIENIFFGIGGWLFDFIRRIGVWGALVNSMFLIAMMLYYQGNQKEMTKLVKNLIKTVIAFFFLVSLVGWVSIIQGT